jgi:DNA-binding XRE family transcriptional regulator
MKKMLINDFDKLLEKDLKEPGAKKLFDQYGVEFEIAYNLLQLRKQKKMSQKTLAKKIGTTQSNIARIEAANQNLSLRTLFKISHALGKKIEIRFL